MAEYYTIPEADAKFALIDHTHNLEELGGTELPANRVAMPAEVSSSFGDAFTIDEGFASIANQMSGKANANHNHSGYAASSHTHNEYAFNNHAHTEYADNDHTHVPADIGAAPASHTHEQAGINGLVDALAAKANASALTAKADLVDGKVPVSQLPSYVSDVAEYASRANFPATGETNKIYVSQNDNKTYRWGGSAYVEISASLALGETSATAYRGDRGKIAYDHSQNGNVHVTAAQKNSWDGKADGNHTHTPASIGAAAESHIHNTKPVTVANEDLNNYITAGIYSFAAGYQPVNRPEGTSNGWLVVIPWNASATVGTIKQFWLRHGTLGSNDHFIYVRTKIGDSGWSSWATVYTSKNPPTAAEVGAISSEFMFMSSTGGTKYAYSSGDLFEYIHALPKGFHTMYCNTAVTNLPNTRETWRFLIHKTNQDSANSLGWVLAFGSNGSVYSNYEGNATTMRGWRCIFDPNPSALWSGVYYMGANQTVTPSKKLSECVNGWVLVWSDYDDDTATANDGDFVTTVIHKRKPGGTTWSGQSHYFDIPRHIGDNYADVATESRIMKRLYVYDDKLVGYSANNQGLRKDVVLRAVYEW